MIEPRLYRMLSGLEQLRRRRLVRFSLAAWWGFIAVVLLCIRFVPMDDARTPTFVTLGIGLAGAVGFLLWKRRQENELGRLAGEIEQENPDMRPLISTALEQRPNPETGEWNLLQVRVVREVLRHPKQRAVHSQFETRARRAGYVNALAMAAVIAFVWFTPESRPNSQSKGQMARRFVESVHVEPGDVEIEKGTSLVVTIEFAQDPPRDATLVLRDIAGTEKRLPLDRQLADPIFGTSLREVRESATYRIEYGGKATRDYAINVFEYPALVRADAELTFPQYTGQTNKVIPDTLRISAVEGSLLDYRFELNKPVAEARLVSQGIAVPLNLSSNLATLTGFHLTNSAKYMLHLRDAEGRTNRRSAELVVQVLPNRAPNLKLTFPRGDQRISSLQELRLEGEVSDDFGVVNFGVGYGVAGAEPTMVEVAQPSAAHEKRTLRELIDVEKLGLQPGEVVAYFVWADDVGPEGNPRRTYSDMYFAEVRPFEEIFRADQSGGGGEEQGGQQGGGGGEGGGAQAGRLTELQKQIVIATWKMQREKGGAPGASQP